MSGQTALPPCEGNASAVLVVSGVVRNGVGVIRGCCMPEVLPHLVARALDSAGAELTVAGAVPDDETLEDAPPGGRCFRILIPLQGLPRAVREVTLTSTQGRVEPEYQSGFQLRNLFYPDRSSFARADIGRKRHLRPSDKETSMFMSGQMAAMFPVGVNEKSDEARVLMVCAYAYRATELMAREDADRAVKLIDAFDSQPHTFTRDDVIERYNVSLLMAQWHAATAAGDRMAFERALLRALAEANQVAGSRHVFVFSYNPIRSMCALAGYSILRGDLKRAEEAFRALRVLLLSAGRAMETRPSHLQEFSRSCFLASNMEHFEALLKHHEQTPRDALLSTPMPLLKGNVEQAVIRTLIQPSIRSDNAPAVITAIQRFVAEA